MKANRKFMKDEEGVSPVIAVILMVAITVVLAATVFVLVSNIGKNVGTTGPQFQMVSGTQTGGSQWIIRVAAVNVKHDFSDYQFVVTLPDLTKVAMSPSSNTGFNTDAQECYRGTWSTASSLNSITTNSSAAAGDGSCTAVDNANYNLNVLFKDVSGDDKFSTGDEVTIKYDDNAADAGNEDFDDTFPSGEWVFEIRHKTSDTLAGSLTRTA